MYLRNKHRLTPVPAAAVIRGCKCYLGITGRKASVGGLISRMLNLSSNFEIALETVRLEFSRGYRISQCSGKMLDIGRNTNGEGTITGLYTDAERRKLGSKRD